MLISAEFIAIVAIIFAISAFVHGSIGFGFPMLATPLLALLTDLQTAILLTLIPTLSMNITSIWGEGNILKALKRFAPFAFLALVGSALGTQLLLYSDPETFRPLLAGIIFLYLAADFFKFKAHWINVYPRLSRFIFGLAAGITGGLTNVMVPVLMIYAFEKNYNKSETIQFSNLSFLVGKVVQIIIFALNSKLTIINTGFSTLMVIFAALGIVLGMKIRQKINQVLYKKLIKAMLFLLAVLLLFT